MNYCSTAAVDAMLARVPLLFVSSALRTSKYTGDQLRDNGVYEATEVDVIESMIEALIEDPVTRAGVVERGFDLVLKIIGDNKIPAAERFRRLIEKVRGPNGVPPEKDTRVSQLPPGDGHYQPIRFTVSSARERYKLLRASVDQGAALNVDSAVALATLIANHHSQSIRTMLLFKELQRDLHTSASLATVEKRLLLSASLLTMRKRLEERQWKAAALFVPCAVAVVGVSALASSEFWSLSAKALVMSTRVTHRAGNWIDRWAHAIRTRSSLPA
jgi:hypothetical protein